MRSEKAGFLFFIVIEESFKLILAFFVSVMVVDFKFM